MLGDSIGVGISMASGAPRFAHNGVAIRSADAIAQIRRAPKGSVAILSLGTNDAVGSIAGVEQAIDRIVSAVQETGNPVVWVGPPCVLKSWNTNVVKLDQILRARLSGKAGIFYVSVADEAVCSRDLRAKDGVHFTMRGYGLLWARARQAAGLSEGVADRPQRDPSAPSKSRRPAKMVKKTTATQTRQPAKAEPKP